MPTIVRARLVDGVLIPETPLDFEEGCEVEITVEEQPRPQTFAEYLAWLDRVQASMPAETWEEMPADGAMRFREDRDARRRGDA